LFDLGGQLTIGRDLGAIESLGSVHPCLKTFKSLFDFVQIYHIQFRRSPKLLVNLVESIPGFTGYGCVMLVKDVHSMVLTQMEEKENKDTFDFGIILALVRLCCCAECLNSFLASYLMSKALNEELKEDKVWINRIHVSVSGDISLLFLPASDTICMASTAASPKPTFHLPLP
jgi:hypothetical protein